MAKKLFPLDDGITAKRSVVTVDVRLTAANCRSFQATAKARFA